MGKKKAAKTKTEGKAPPTQFKELVDEKFIKGQGRTLTSSIACVHVAADVHQSAIRKAYKGQRVKPETAVALKDWAFAEYGVMLDLEAMITAPTLANWQPQSA